MRSEENCGFVIPAETERREGKGRGYGVLVLFIVSSVIAAGMGCFILRDRPGGIDYMMIHAALRSMIEHRDPYRTSVMDAEWMRDGGRLPINQETGKMEHIPPFPYPPTLAILMPFSELSWKASHIIWMGTLILVLSIASYLLWRMCVQFAPNLSFLLLALSLGTGSVFFASGNPAGMAIGLCLIGCWCIINEQVPWLGVVCLAAGLLIKPHDVLLVWVCFLAAGGLLRRRALQTLVVTMLLALPGIWRITQISPGWPSELRANLAALSARGEIDDPRPEAYSDHTAGVMINLQAGVSLFDDNERVYNGMTFLVCGAMILVWLREIVRDRQAERHIWYSLAVAAPITMLISYHRSYDAKLLLICLPALLQLWSRRGVNGRIAFLLLATSIGLINEVTISFLNSLTQGLPVHRSGLSRYTPLVVLAHPISFTLLAMSLFTLRLYILAVRDSTDEFVLESTRQTMAAV